MSHSLLFGSIAAAGTIPIALATALNQAKTDKGCLDNVFLSRHPTISTEGPLCVMLERYCWPYATSCLNNSFAICCWMNRERIHERCHFGSFLTYRQVLKQPYGATDVQPNNHPLFENRTTIVGRIFIHNLVCFLERMISSYWGKSTCGVANGSRWCTDFRGIIRPSLSRHLETVY